MGEKGTDAELTVLIGADGGEYSQSFFNTHHSLVQAIV